MDMRQFAPPFIKVDQVRDGDIHTRILIVLDEPDRYGRPVIELENGSKFSLNTGNCNALINALRAEPKDWVGKEVIFSLGTYKDFSGEKPEEKETVKVSAVSPARHTSQNGSAPAAKPLPPSRTAPTKCVEDDMDDQIPF